MMKKMRISTYVPEHIYNAIDNDKGGNTLSSYVMNILTIFVEECILNENIEGVNQNSENRIL